MSSAPSPLDELFRHREEFKNFLTTRLNSAAEAEDLLQDSLAKAVARASDLRDETKLRSWFYQLLRHALTDYIRSRSAARRREEAWANEAAAAADPELDRHVCRCFEGLLPTLKPDQAELLRRVELEGASLSESAAQLGITANHAGVSLHRARRELRRRLEAFCGDCSAAACLDCDCGEDHVRGSAPVPPDAPEKL